MQRVRLRRTALRATPRMHTSTQPPDGAGRSRSKAQRELTLGLVVWLGLPWLHCGSEPAREGSLTVIVPTLRVGMPPGTLRVPLLKVTRSVTGCMPTQSAGTIKSASVCQTNPQLHRLAPLPTTTPESAGLCALALVSNVCASLPIQRSGLAIRTIHRRNNAPTQVQTSVSAILCHGGCAWETLGSTRASYVPDR
jgi:hypothetical protein